MRHKTNLKVFQYQISTSVKRSEKQLASKASFSTFLELSCLNFRLKLCERVKTYKKCERNQVDEEKIVSRNNHSQNIRDKIFETHVNHVKLRKKVLISIFQQLFASINKIFILGGRLSTRL